MNRAQPAGAGHFDGNAPDHVSLFAYDNRTFIVQNYQSQPVNTRVYVARASRLRLADGATLPFCHHKNSAGSGVFWSAARFVVPAAQAIRSLKAPSARRILGDDSGYEAAMADPQAANWLLAPVHHLLVTITARTARQRTSGRLDILAGGSSNGFDYFNPVTWAPGMWQCRASSSRFLISAQHSRLPVWRNGRRTGLKICLIINDLRGIIWPSTDSITHRFWQDGPIWPHLA